MTSFLRNVIRNFSKAVPEQEAAREALLESERHKMHGQVGVFCVCVYVCVCMCVCVCACLCVGVCV